VWYRPHWVGYVFLSNAIASLLTIFLLLPEILQLKLKFDISMFKEMLIYSWPILIANISYIINESLDKQMLKHMLPHNISDQEVGIYGACAKIALFLSIFVQAFRLGAEPFFFSHAKNKNSGDTYARIMTYFVITVAVICVALTANIDILALIIVGKPTHIVHHQIVNNVYWSGLGVVPPLLFGYLSLGIYMNLSVWYKLRFIYIRYWRSFNHCAQLDIYSKIQLHGIGMGIAHCLCNHDGIVLYLGATKLSYPIQPQKKPGLYHNFNFARLLIVLYI